LEGTSSFGQVEAAAGSSWQAAGRLAFGALEGAAAAVPLSLGCATLVFGRVAPDFIASGVFATMLALVLMHVATAGNGRAMCFSGRILEATTAAAMVEQLVPDLPTWGMVDSAGVRLAFLCAICAAAGLFVCALYLLRADRLTPFIPAPVFAGFSNSIAVALLLSQWRALRHLAAATPLPGGVISIALVALACAFVVRRWLPGRPAAAAGLVAGLLAALGWKLGFGLDPATVGGGAAVSLPLALADFRAMFAPGVRYAPVLLFVLGHAAILGTMVFINTALSAQAMTQVDRRPAGRTRDGVVAGLAMAAGGLTGSAPMSGSILCCLAVARSTPLRAASLLLVAIVTALVWLTGVLAHMPLGAIVGVLLCESWFLLDRPSLRLAADWLLRRPLPRSAREDLVLVVSVTVLAVITNMVIAAFAGLVFGLFLVAVRSARQPVRHVWNGTQMSSNCARSSPELQVLAQHGTQLRVFELEGDLFFAVGATLDRSLNSGSEGALCVVLDWSRVRHIDSSVGAVVAAFEREAEQRGLIVVHAGAAAPPDGDVASELRRRQPRARLAPDLDFALEVAENYLVRHYLREPPRDASSMLDAAPLFEGFTPEERATIEGAMTQKVFAAGTAILRAGDCSDELMLVLQGAASILVPGADGQPVRLAGVRRGSVVGELGFLDHSPRSATVVAQTDVLVATLGRAAFEQLSRNGDPAVPKLLANLASALAQRLRHTSRLAIARSRTR
jgi:sulfate permease, SulP family